MSDVINIVFDDKGVAHAYDDTYDLTIHCESEEEQNKIIEILNKYYFKEDE